MSPDPLAVLHDRPPMPGVPTLRIRVLPSWVSYARSTATRMLAGLVPAGHLDDVEMCVSELVTNAIHAAEEYAKLLQFGWSYWDTPIHLGVATHARWTRLDVRDPNPAMPATIPGGLMDDHGRGLFIVDALAAARWHTSTAHDKTVHVIIPMPLVKLTDAEITAIKAAVRAHERGCSPPPRT